MRTLSAIMTVAALVVTVAGPAHAADLFTPSLQSSSAGTGHVCLALNKSTISNITVTLQIIAPFVGVQATCGPTVVPPQDIMSCFVDDGGYFSYCKVTTTSPSNTRANLMVLGAGGVPLSSAPAK